MSQGHVTTDLGESIRRLRTAKDLTQQQLGDLVGVKQHAVSQWERGSSYPARQHMRALADALDVDPSELFEEWATP
jgi:transcriptional regulator with XRE-family HTH domain